MTETLHEIKPTQMPHRSEQLNELFAALAKAQAEMPMAGLTSNNPYFKSRYANFAEIVKASRPALTKNGISVMQRKSFKDDGVELLHTMLCHISGQWIESISPVIPPKNDIQARGSYITYLKRYDYASLVGVITGDEDDDGEAAMVEVRKNPQPLPKEPERFDTPEYITPEQLEELEYELTGFPDLAADILRKLNLQSLSALPKKGFLSTISRIRDIKSLRNTNGTKQGKLTI